MVAASLCLIALVALTLRSVHARVLEDRVRTHLRQADDLAGSGQLEAAVVQYRAVLHLERDDTDAARSLALTLLRLGRLSESETYFRDLLQANPTDGALNRGLARIHAARGRDADTRAAYQRAIYGQWPGNESPERVATRFEFVQYLTRSGDQAEVLSELLRLRAELPPSRTADARRTAELLAQHGAGALGLETLAAAAAASPRDVDLLAQLAEQQLKAGQTVEARLTLQRALAIEQRSALRTQLAVVDRVLALDPSLPRLGILARTRRARLLLGAVLTRTAGCGPKTPQVDRIRQEANRNARRTADAARAERELALAGELWGMSPACHGDDVESRALAEILERLKTMAAQG
jgi:tetratricopeptide (TPR) repeat protein